MSLTRLHQHIKEQRKRMAHLTCMAARFPRLSFLLPAVAFAIWRAQAALAAIKNDKTSLSRSSIRNEKKSHKWLTLILSSPTWSSACLTHRSINTRKPIKATHARSPLHQQKSIKKEKGTHLVPQATLSQPPAPVPCLPGLLSYSLQLQETAGQPLKLM
jgi:hypothetical protein